MRNLNNIWGSTLWNLSIGLAIECPSSSHLSDDSNPVRIILQWCKQDNPKVGCLIKGNTQTMRSIQDTSRYQLARVYVTWILKYSQDIHIRRSRYALELNIARQYSCHTSIYPSVRGSFFFSLFFLLHWRLKLMDSHSHTNVPYQLTYSFGTSCT